MPALLKDLIAHLDHLLEPERFKDYCPNGLQVPGKHEVSKVVSAVSAGAELFERAAQEKADLVLVHHGLFWDSSPSPIDAPMKRRLKLLFDANIGLAAYHLPLDAHRELGNNALIARALGAEAYDGFAQHEGQAIGVLARLPGEGIDSGELRGRVAKLTERAPLVFDAGPELIRTLAIVSGAGASYLPDAIALGIDAFLTGEPAERVMSEAREGGIHFIAAGHYATETFGVKRLGERLSERVGIDHVFIDVPNPV
jgi:dinuclear metal center YbgI/SA1388 family protein